MSLRTFFSADGLKVLESSFDILISHDLGPQADSEFDKVTHLI